VNANPQLKDYISSRFHFRLSDALPCKRQPNQVSPRVHKSKPVLRPQIRIFAA
jgi:hypothetical protein